MSKNIVCALRFQQLLANKHDRLRDGKFGRVAIGSCNVGDKKKQEDLLDLITALFKLALQSHRSADYKAVLDDSSIIVDTTSLDQHKLFLLVIFVP